MASPLEQNQLNCSICLKLFNDPVSTPCGHNFCKSCLCAFWDISDLCRCPLCMETFYSRPKLDINTSFRELVEHFKTLTVDEELVARSGEVACDICTGKKLKALKSCLVCLTSFCKSHLEPHQRVSTLKIHKLIDPVENLENRMCVKHQRLLELFCRDDQSCVCHLCCETDHKRHLIVSLEAASELERTETETNIKEIQRMMQERQIRIQEMFDSLDNIKKSALEEIDVSTQVFTAMTEFVVKCQNELIEEIKEKMKTKEKRLGEIIANLVQEMTELQKRSNELEQFLQTEDHFNLLQIEFISCARIATCKVQDFINKEKERLSAVEIDQIKRFTGPRGRVLSEEQFSCSICLEIFVEPVSTPCGHSFCKACLQGYWNHSKKFTCPMCKKSYHKKPELSINRVLAEISTQFQGLMADGGGGGGATDGGGLGLSPGSTLTLGGSERVEGGGGHVGSPGLEGGDFARAGEVPCDSCIGRKIKAKKSCLSCPGSYCEVHLKHHKKVKSLASHRLIEPVFHLEEKICKKHQRLLEAYCRHDHACICISCGDTAHKTHEIVSLDREWKKKMSNLGKRKLELKHLIKERAKILEEIKQSIKVIKTSAQKELEDSWQVYAELQRLVEQSQAELVELIATRQREAERQAQEVARGLENELSLLRRRSAELDALAQTQDKVLFLQAFPGLPPPPDPSDWSGVSVNTDLYLGSIRSSVGTLVDRFQEELKRLHGKELRKLQNYSSEVILDSATAQRDLVLSDDGHQVKYEERKATAPAPSEGPHRFSPALFVLGREGLTSGRHYWEVDTARKTAWTLGVARASARRKGEIKLSPDGGFWCLWLKGGEIKALASARVALPLASPPAKVAVFLDYEAGRVSFYDAKARQHLYTFHDMFSESLHPIFSPCLNQEGKNAAPLVLNPVKHG